MKINAIRWNVIFLLCLTSLISQGQSDASFEYTIDQTTSLVDVVTTLEGQYGLDFSYDAEALASIWLRPQKFTASSLEDLLGLILADANSEYRLGDDDTVLIRVRTDEKVEAAQPSLTNISGRIEDNSGSPVAYAAVALDTLFIGADTDESGFFEFNIPSHLSDRELIIQSLGYHSRRIPIQDLLDDTSIILQAEVLDIDEVDVIDKIKSIESNDDSSATTARGSDIRKNVTSPGLTNDALRSVQMQAGVSASNDGSAEIKIRGSQSDETLIMLDGIPIYKADHYFGIFGAINGNHVNTITLYKNMLPLQYGGKTGGMVDMNSKNYIGSGEGIADVNMLTSSMTFAAPLGDKWSIMASGRTTFNNAADSKIFGWADPSSDEEELLNGLLSERPLILNTTPVIQFFDINGKLLFKPNDNHRLSLNYFQSQDDYDNSYDISFEQANQREGQEEFSEIDQSKNFGLSALYNGNFKNGWSLNASLHHSLFQYEGGFFTSQLLERVFQGPRFADMTNSKSNRVSDLGGQAALTKKINDQHKVTIGASTTHHEIDFQFQQDDTREFNNNSVGTESAIFTSYVWQPSSKWYVDMGLRLNHYSATAAFYPSPRIFGRYTASDHWFIKSAFSKNYQFLREVTLYTRLREPIDIFLLSTDKERSRAYPVGNSTNFMIGMNLNDGPWYFDLELYHRNLGGVVEHTPFQFGADQDPELNKPVKTKIETLTGDGKVIGADLTLGFEQKAYTGYLAYTLSKNTNQFQEVLNGQAFPSQDDRRHQLKMSNQWSFGNWTLSGNYIFSSGKSFIDIEKLNNNTSNIDIRNTTPDALYSMLPSYHRVDLGLNYDFKLLGQKSTIGLEVFNLTNNKNVDYIQYLFVLPKGAADERQITGTSTLLLDRTFNLVFNVEW